MRPAGIRCLVQLPHRAGQPRCADEAATGLQPVQLALQGAQVLLQQGLGHRVAYARQLGQEQFAQGDEMVALPVQGRQRGDFVPVFTLAVQGRTDGGRGGAGAVDQRTAHGLEQLFAGERFDQGVAEAGIAQPRMNAGIAIGGMRQRGRVRP